VGRKRPVPAQTLLCREGDVTDRFFVLAAGMVEIGKTILGEPVSLQICGPGSVLCLMPALDEDPCTVSVRAVQEATVIEVTRADLLAILATDREQGLDFAIALTVQSIRGLRRSTDDLALAIYRALRSPERPPQIGAADLAQVQAGNHAWLAA